MKRVGRRPMAAALLVLAILVPSGASGAAAGTETLYVLAGDGGVGALESLHDRLGAVVTGTIEDVDLQRVVAPLGASTAYDASGLVRAVERPPTYRLFRGRPNDPLMRLQWGLRRVNAFDAWRIENARGSGVLVGVIDSGIDATHPDLKNQFVEGFDFLEYDDDPYDDNGHGTHVSGIVAARTDNRRGVAGLAPGVKVIPMKACASAGNCDPFAVFAGAVDAVRRGAAVINLSLGGPGECSTIQQVVFDWVHDQGTTVIVSAGNEAEKGNPTISPANCERTLGVGAIDSTGRIAPFSSFGDFVDVSAPGVDVWSTLPPLASLWSPYSGYGPGDGTSMAAPFVAAAAALIVAEEPEATPDQIMDALISSARDAGPQGRDDRYGHGVLDARGALKQ